MANSGIPPKVRPVTQIPNDQSLSQQMRQALDQMRITINQLVGQANANQGTGLQTFGAGIIDPTSAQINSAGSRTVSIATPLTYSATTTSINFFWDGSNSSQPFQIFRDDGTVTGPTIAGSGIGVTGLSPSTTYFFYFYWDESLQSIKFAILEGQGVGNPPGAYTSFNYTAAQQQILRGRVPICPTFSTVGITTPNAGTGSGGGGTGGGGGGGRFCPLSGAPVKLYGKDEWWSKTVKPQTDFIEITTASGRVGTFTPAHRIYTRIGLLPLAGVKVGDWALTEDGEEQVTELHDVWIPDGTVDCYEATEGHIYSAWGFISHNVKPVS